MARILIADDEPDIRALVSLRLELSGHDVEAVGDGDAAVSRCHSYSPDLVILDVMMPKMSGLEACRSIRSTPRLAHVPIILLSAQSRDCDIKVGMESGADEYLTKPFSPLELATRVDDLLAWAVSQRGDFCVGF